MASLSDVMKMLRPLNLRIANLVARGVVRLVNDSAKLQLLQVDVLSEETRDDVERVQSYGFTSRPLAGAEAVVLFVGGRREHGLAVAVDDRRYRKTDLEPGEVAIYTDQGDSVVIRRGGTIEVTASTKVKLTATVVELAGNTDAAIRGTAHRSADAALSTALSTFVGLLGTYLGKVLPIAGPTAPETVAIAAAATALTTAVTAYESAAAAALSTKVKLS